MSLQKLLLKLSENKTISVSCFIADEKCQIDISEMYTFKSIKKIVLDLNEEIDIKLFSDFL